MITRLLHDTKHAKVGTPVAFVGWEVKRAQDPREELVSVELPTGEVVDVPASAVEAGHEPEESLPVLAEQTGIPYDTLARYVRDGRILARKSGGIWLTTRRAVEYANIAPRK